jgi:hypothetical protein
MSGPALIGVEKLVERHAVLIGTHVAHQRIQRSQLVKATALAQDLVDEARPGHRRPCRRHMRTVVAHGHEAHTQLTVRQGVEQIGHLIARDSSSPPGRVCGFGRSVARPRPDRP